MRAALGPGTGLVLMTLVSPARATFSVVAADPASGAIGSAGASCVPYEVIRILGVTEGRGVLVAQANFDDEALAEGAALLAAGEAPATVLEAITDVDAFPNAPWMQYGIVDVEGRTASTTGPNAKAFADDAAGESGSVRFTVQGNLLTGPEVLTQMASALQEGCDLPERLVRAMEAAGAGGAGDARCTGEGLPSASAYLFVAWKDGAVLRVSVPDVRPADPVVALREALEEARAEHPCPKEGHDPKDEDTPEVAGPGGCALSPAPGPEPGAPVSAALVLWIGLGAAARRRPWPLRRAFMPWLRDRESVGTTAQGALFTRSACSGRRR